MDHSEVRAVGMALLSNMCIVFLAPERTLLMIGLNPVLLVGEIEASKLEHQNRDLQNSIPVFFPLHTAFLTGSETGNIFVDRLEYIYICINI